MTEDDLYKNLEDYSQEELEIQQKIAKESAKLMQEEMEDLTKELEKSGLDLAEEVEALHARPDLDVGDVDVEVLLDESEKQENFSNIGIEEYEDLSEIEDVLADAEIIGDLPQEIEFE